MQVHSNLSLVNSTYLYFVINSHRVVFIVRGQTCLVITLVGEVGTPWAVERFIVQKIFMFFNVR